MAPTLIWLTPSASRILIGGSVVFMALPMAKVRVRAACTSIIRPCCTIQVSGNRFKAIDGGGVGAQCKWISQFIFSEEWPCHLWECPAVGTLPLTPLCATRSLTQGFAWAVLLRLGFYFLKRWAYVPVEWRPREMVSTSQERKCAYPTNPVPALFCKSRTLNTSDICM